jgi:NAD/NADP transhydrogenase alpha subunit
MTHKSIGYHTRLDGRNTVKVTGGSFPGTFDLETVNRLIKSQFTVKVQPSGRAVFVDKGGRAVSVYITVDPDQTEIGKLALAEDRKARDDRERAECDKAAQVEKLLSTLSHDEIIKRLSQ